MKRACPDAKRYGQILNEPVKQMLSWTCLDSIKGGGLCMQQGECNMHLPKGGISVLLNRQMQIDISSRNFLHLRPAGGAFGQTNTLHLVSACAFFEL